MLGYRQGEGWGEVLASHPAAGQVGGQEVGQNGAGQGSCVPLGCSFSGAAGGDGAPSRNSPRWWQKLAQASAALKARWSLAGLAYLLRVPEAGSERCPAPPPASTQHSSQDIPVSSFARPAAACPSPAGLPGRRARGQQQLLLPRKVHAGRRPPSSSLLRAGRPPAWLQHVVVRHLLHGLLRQCTLVRGVADPSVAVRVLLLEVFHLLLAVQLGVLSPGQVHHGV